VFSSHTVMNRSKALPVTALVGESDGISAAAAVVTAHARAAAMKDSKHSIFDRLSHYIR
jgi:hypothetical protein